MIRLLKYLLYFFDRKFLSNQCSTWNIDDFILCVRKKYKFVLYGLMLGDILIHRI